MLDRVAQSLRAVKGTTFERIVANILNRFLIQDDIIVTRAREASLKTLIKNRSNLRLEEGLMWINIDFWALRSRSRRKRN